MKEIKKIADMYNHFQGGVDTFCVISKVTQNYTCYTKQSSATRSNNYFLRKFP